MKFLVTGGTGYLGRALVRRLLLDGHEVVIFSRDEYKQSEMVRKIKSKKVTFYLGDVRNLERLKEAAMGVDVIIHTAAFKRMDTVSHNAYEVAEVNITGTKNVMEAGRNCKKVIFVSSDKAYAPSNLYGASKMVAEHIALSYKNAVVWRFGNFIGSRGSVWEIFKDQIARGVSVTITDPNATRFVMEIEDVVDYVLSDVEPGLHYPKNLKSMTIFDILMSVVPNRQLVLKDDLIITGLRDGEKMHEAFNEDYSSDKGL